MSFLRFETRPDISNCFVDQMEPKLAVSQRAPHVDHEGDRYIGITESARWCG